MSSIIQNKQVLALLESEYYKLPSIITDVVRVLGNNLSTEGTPTERSARYAFKVLLTVYVVQAFLKSTHLANIEETSSDLGENVIADLKSSIEKSVQEFINLSHKNLVNSASGSKKDTK